MTTTHTPGPWMVAHESEPQRSDGVILESPNGFEIRPDGDQKLGEEAADLRLAAAAPDLLAVVKGFHSKLATYVNVYPGDKQLCRLLRECNAAIDKATGVAA